MSVNHSIIKLFGPILFPMICYSQADGQISITGPDCVVAGVEYQYVLSGKPGEASKMKICVSGGSLVGSTGRCIGDTILTEVHVIWNEGGSPSITLSANSQNVTKTPMLTKALSAGALESTVTIQILKSNLIPSRIVCSEASGGDCSPTYLYQWQISFDGIAWVDIAGATQKDFAFSASLSKSSFYRRKVTDTASGSIAYSSVAAVFVEPVSQ